MYRGPDCISQVYGTRLKPLHNDPLTARLFASGRKLLSPDRPAGNGGILRDIRTAGPARLEDEGVVFRRNSLSDKVVDSWYTPELLPKSLNTTGMQDACTIDKLKQEIQRLQKTLSDKEDLVLATRRIAADKERKLKGELMEVTDKYSEVCQEKVSLEDEIILLKDSSVQKDEHDKLFTLYTKTEALVFELQSKLVNCAATVPLEEYRMLQRELEESTDEVLQYKDIAARKEKELEAVILSQSDRIQALKDEHAKQLAEGHKITKKEVTDRDEKLRLLKEQITSALDEKSIARQEQLKELSRELEHTAQENRILHKKIQELSQKVQNCDNCAKLKSQLKSLQDGNGRRLVDVNILKPIKDSLDPEIEPVPPEEEEHPQEVTLLPPVEEILPPIPMEEHSPSEDKPPSLEEIKPLSEEKTLVPEEKTPLSEEKIFFPGERTPQSEEKPPLSEEKTALPEEEAQSPLESTLPPREESTLPPDLPPPPPLIEDLPISFHHDYDTLSPEHERGAEQEKQGSRVKQDSGVDEECFVDAEESFPESHAYSPVEEEKKAVLEELRQPAQIEVEDQQASLDHAMSEETPAESPTSTLVEKTGEATLKLIGDYDYEGVKKSPELTKSVFDKIRAFFDEPTESESDADKYAPISITTSKCSVCQGLHKGGSSGSSPHDHDFSIYGPLTIDGSPDSTGSFCPLCQSRAEHDYAVKSNSH